MLHADRGSEAQRRTVTAGPFSHRRARLLGPGTLPFFPSGSYVAHTGGATPDARALVSVVERFSMEDRSRPNGVGRTSMQR
ncbi:MAG: hypothetical protein JNM94_06000 [Phycisphaerae bacterium]|nr:hypothetical protein [Phycisphaerae bacterium]